MSYVSENLMNDEEVLYQTRLHWMIYVPGMLMLAAFVWFFSEALTAGKGSKDHAVWMFLLGVGCFVFGLGSLIRGWIERRTTEIAVTNKRTITKTGLIKRETMELNHQKVESYAVDQSVLGRLLGFGTLLVTGTGGNTNRIKNVDSPMLFREAAMGVADRA